jgi:hypothetical protein
MAYVEKFNLIDYSEEINSLGIIIVPLNRSRVEVNEMAKSPVVQRKQKCSKPPSARCYAK